MSTSIIQIITTDQVRYVGILSEINKEDQSVELRNITIFGTEEREVETKVKKESEKLDLKIFKGSEIIELNVIKQDQLD